MRERTDVLVIGGGPAGLAAAIAARRKGLDVTVVDGARPPIDKACGEGLMPDTLAALRELGVVIQPGDGRIFRGMRFLDETTSAEANFPELAGFAIRRKLLHEKMVERAQECGVSLLWGAPVTGLAKDEAIVSGTLLRAKWIVGADGIGSRVRRWSALDSNSRVRVRFAQRRHYRIEPWTDCVEVHWGRQMQAYVTPLGNGETCIVLISRDPQMRLEEAWREFPRLAARLRNAEPSSVERGAVTATRRLDRVFRGNIALIGDASGSVDAITGEGLGLSFRQALALADALQAGELKSYQEAHRRLAWRPHFMSRLLLLLERNSFLRKRVLRALSEDPNVFRRLLAVHGGESSPAFLAATGVRLGWQLLAA
jgi:flavin-dependent dehydrogenase